MADPDRLFDFIKVGKHLANVLTALPRKLYVLVFIDVFDVHEECVCNFHKLLEFFKPLAFLCEWCAGSIDACVDSTLLCLCKKLKKKIQLEQWLATAYSNSAFAAPVALAAFSFIQKLVCRIILSISKIP